MMNTTKTKVLFGMLLIISGFSIFFSAPRCSAKVYREKCSKNITWKYNTKTKVLKISGKGAVTKTIVAGKRKGGWGEQGKNGDIYLPVEKIIFSEGITAIDCPKLFGYIDVEGRKGKKAKLKLPDSLEYIGSFSFKDWRTDIRIPKNVKEIAPLAISPFASYPYFPVVSMSVSVAADNPYFCSIDGVVFSKDKKTLIYYPQSKTQKEYKVPSSVKKIAPLAFQNTYNLRKVILPDGLKKLGSGAFYGCTLLRDVNLSDKMKIKSITDYDTTQLYDKPKDMEIWDDYSLDHQDLACIYHENAAFSDPNYPYASGTRAGTFEGTAIRSIHIPNSVKYLSSNTFFNDGGKETFTNLEKISFGKDFSGKINTGNSHGGMKTLTLNGGHNLKISIPKSNKKYCVEDDILYSKDKSVVYFASGYEGKTLTLPETVKKIANGAFASSYTNTVYKLRHVIIPGDLESIGYNAFAGSEIKSFTCRGKIGQMGAYAFSDCYKLETVNIKEIKEIPESAFEDCYALKTVDCGTKVEKIGAWAFEADRELTKVAVGKQLQSLAETAFKDCTSLSPEDIPKLQAEETLLAFRQLIQEAYGAHLPFYRARMEWQKAVREVES